MGKVALGVSLAPDGGCARAIAPFLRTGALEAVEWTVDVALQRGIPDLPGWMARVLGAFSRSGRLWAHGVGLSGMSGAGTTPRQRAWIDGVAELQATFPARSLSVHAGWSTAADVVYGAPLAPPVSSGHAWTALSERLQLLRQRVGVPVGVENLGFGWCARDALARGARWAQLVQSPAAPYLHLDLHNLWCQAATWSLDPIVLLERLPLHCARVIHVAGGHWSTPIAGAPPVRRDTHDHAIPDAVWSLLPQALARCANVEVVFYERVPGAWADSDRIHAELTELQAVLESPVPDIGTASQPRLQEDAETVAREDGPMLAAWQAQVLGADSAAELQRRLRSNEPYGTDFDDVDPRMVSVAVDLVQRWARREGTGGDLRRLS